MMKNLVILYGGGLTRHAFEKVFDGASAFGRVLSWAGVFGDRIVLLTETAPSDVSVNSEIASFCGSGAGIEVISRDSWSKADFISQIAGSLKKYDAARAVVSYADTPFLNERLTRELLEMHERYAAEYSFADGFPYGLAPEIIESGAASILAGLATSSLGEEGGKRMDREALFSVMRGDINSFEIETLISDVDYRLLRFEFESSSRINALACESLFDEARMQNIDVSDAYALSDLASRTERVCRTVPAFYNIQISSRYNHRYCYSLEAAGKNPCARDFMPLSDFRRIMSEIAGFSESAVISLSAFGEPLLNPEFLDFALEVISMNDGSHRFPLLIETDGLLVTDALAAEIAAAASSRRAEVNWIVCADAVDKSSYAALHNCDEADFEKALACIALLAGHFPRHVYPQFMRMRTNEAQLEPFYRFWSDKSSPSQGGLIIQKYNSVCGVLPDLKPADLSPVRRLPCWHLRRDMTILSDGTVPLCFQLSFPESAGNILTDGIGRVWDRARGVLESHIAGEYPGNCSVCDESYTFNF